MCNDCPICIAPLFPTNTNIMRLKKKVLVRRGERLPVTKLKCGHTFHNSCIKQWFMKTDVDASDRCPMCRDKIRFKKSSKDLMMNKLRWDDPDYRYGDENIYEVETESDYTDDGLRYWIGRNSEWGDAWDEVVDILIQDTGHEDLSVPLGENWTIIVSTYLNGSIDQDGVWDRVDAGRNLRELIDSIRDDQAWSRGGDAWEEAVRNIEQL